MDGTHRVVIYILMILFESPVHWVDFPHSLCRLLSSWLWSFLSDSLGCAIYVDYIGPGSKQHIDIAYVEDILGKGIVWTSGGSAAPLRGRLEKRNWWWRVGSCCLAKRFGDDINRYMTPGLYRGHWGVQVFRGIFLFSSGVQVRMLQSLPCYTTLSRQFVDHPGAISFTLPRWGENMCDREKRLCFE